MLRAGSAKSILATALLLSAAAVAQTGDGAMTERHATGTFEVTITPEAQDAGTEAAVPTARMGLQKRFSGGLEGTAVGTMLTAGAPGKGAAAYVAIDQVQGTLEGRSGGFLLVHRGTMTKSGGGDRSVVIAPESGTGQLAGIAGTLAIEVKDGKHLYDLVYTLPALARP